LRYFALYSSFLRIPRPPRSTLFPYTTLFPSDRNVFRRDFFVRKLLDKIIFFRFHTHADGCNQTALLHVFCERQTFFRFESMHNRWEEHTSELQSRENLVCRLLLEKKKKTKT